MRTQRSAYVLDATDMSARSAAGREITLIAAGTACPCGRNHDQSRKALVELLSQSKLLMYAELAIELRTLGIEELRPSHLPGDLDETADDLSRRAAPGSAAKSFPAELDEAKDRQEPVRGDRGTACRHREGAWTGGVRPRRRGEGRAVDLVGFTLV